MPPNPRALDDLNHARSAFATAQSDSEWRLAEVAESDAKRTELQRTRDPTDPQLAAAEAAYALAMAELRRARAWEGAAKDDVQAKLATWLGGFATNDLEEVSQLAARFPLVLLPVRLETRFFPVDNPTELRVRIYPDEILAETHDPLLTTRERHVGEAYWTSSWNRANESVAWRTLVRQYPPARAAWIVRATTPTNLASRPSGAPVFPPHGTLRPASWTRPAEARALPDRWMVLAYRDGREVHRAVSGPVRDPLALSLDPAEDDRARLVDVSGDRLFVDTEMVWMIDYDRALEVGMAVTIARLASDDLTRGFDRLLVLGVKASLEPKEAGARLAALLRGHRYAHGLVFVPQGTPTNNTADAPSGYPPQDPGGSVSFRLERQGLSPIPESDGTRFLTALGLRRQLAGELPHLAGADRTEHLAARAMNRALWPATWGYFLEQMMAPGFDQAALRATRDYFVGYVHGRGPFPAFRVGGTPYGLLPVSSLARWAPDRAATGPEARLPAVLTAARHIWLQQSDHVARIGRSGDPDADLLAVLAMDASTREVRIRGAWGEDFIANFFRFYGTAFFGVSGSWAAWSDRREQVAGGLRQLLERMGWSAATPDPRLAWMAYTNTAFRFRFPLVTGEPISEEAPLTDRLGLPGQRNYIDWIGQAPILMRPGTNSLQQDGVENPPLLYLLLRQAMLLEYARVALDILIVNGLASEADRREPELVNIPIGAASVQHSPAWERFRRPVPAITGAQPLEEYLRAGGQPGTRESDEYRDTLRFLARLPGAELERLFTETLDVCTHRLDAGVTSLAAKRLESMRQVEPEHAHLGAFGWAEHVRRATGISPRQLDGRTVYVQATNGGHVHTPSPTHAAAAAVLRNGFLTRAAERQKSLSINLSSARVRAARWLLDAVRQGQPLGAVLGYRFERGLHERKLEKFVTSLRRTYPLVAYKNTQTPPATPAVESIAARNVVDGLRLWRATNPFAGLSPTPSPAELNGLKAELDAIREALDAVADLLTAESVYQMVRGNADASTASLDAMAQGARPPDPEIARVPRGGIALTHRVVLVLGGSPTAPPPGWPTTLTPRAQAEPYVDGWAGAFLGDPRLVKCLVSYPDPTQQDPQRRAEVEVLLSELQLRPIDVLALAGEPVPAGQASELDRRVIEVALPKVPARQPAIAPADLRIDYAPALKDRAKERSFLAIMETARLLLAVVGGSRPLRPADLLPPEEAAWARAAGRLTPELLDPRTGRVLVARKTLEAVRATLIAEIAALAATPQGTAPNLGPLLAALNRAALVGVPGAFPISRDREALLAQGGSAETEIKRRMDETDRRIARAQQLNNTVNQQMAAGATVVGVAELVQAIVEEAVEAIKAAFGRGCPFLPRFTPAADTAAELDRALGAGSTLVGGDGQATRKWLQQAARVRTPLGRWRKLTLYATALGTATAALEVAQLPYIEGTRWAALPFQGAPPRSGLLSLVLSRPVAPTATEPWVGLVLDEWSELIPHPNGQTGIVFHYDDPGAEAAQAVLIAVPPTVGARTWEAATTGLNLSHKLSFALSWGTLHKGGSPWHTNTRDPGPMPSFGTARRSRCPRWKRWNNG